MSYKKLLLVFGILFVVTAFAMDVTQEVTVEVLPSANITITIHSPTDGTYDARRLQFNITTSEEAEKIEFINYNDKNPRWKRLCRNCDEYGFTRKKMKSLNEGKNNVTIRATMAETGEIVEESFFVITDSRDPRITKTEPRRGLSNGHFLAEFREVNPTSLFITYGNLTIQRSEEVNLSACVEERRKTVCEFFVNLTDFENEEIEYWLNLTDIIGNEDISRIREVEVDTTPPLINNWTASLPDGRRVTFTFNVIELNFDNIEYIDYEDRNPRWRTLCSRLKDGICEKRKTFRRGDHTLDITAFDDAGNEKIIVEGLEFEIL